MSLVRKQADGRNGRAAPLGTRVPSDSSSAASGPRSVTGVVNEARPTGRVRLPGDVNEPLVDERSVVSCRWPTSLKNEGATLLSFSLQ